MTDTSAKVLIAQSLAHWRKHPIEFIETCLFDPETGRPYKLLPAERVFLEHVGGDSRRYSVRWWEAMEEDNAKRRQETERRSTEEETRQQRAKEEFLAHQRKHA